jgi:hypothetical protein
MYNPCGMQRLLPRWVCLLAICSVPGWATPLCATDSLANYISAGSCQLGNFTLDNFGYTFTGGASYIGISDNNITVTPYIATDVLGLQFSSGDFAEPAGDSATLVVTYTWDPGDIRSLEDILDPPSYMVQIATVDCENAPFSIGCTPSDNLAVSDNGITLIATDTVSFSPGVFTLGIQNTIDLDGTGGAAAAFSYFDNQITIPEPSTVAPCLLLAVLVSGRLRLKRA